jgi:hypothetical protein
MPKEQPPKKLPSESVSRKVKLVPCREFGCGWLGRPKDLDKHRNDKHPSN